MRIISIKAPIIMLFLTSITPSFAQDLPVLGYLERSKIGPVGVTLIGKLDTGADMSSLGYTKLFKFKKNGRRWVRFTVKDELGINHDFELPVVGTSKIRRRRGGASIKRPVVEMKICVGNISAMTLVNLSNRKRFSTKLLIGRSFLHRRALVDSSRALKTELSCSDKDIKQ
jgi:hypothetical protein